MKPTHVHDCAVCRFLGHFEGYDLYICGEGLGAYRQSVIARYGSEGPQYVSAPLDVIQSNVRRDANTVTTVKLLQRAAELAGVAS